MTAETEQAYLDARREPPSAVEPEVLEGGREEARRERRRGLPTWKSRLTRRILILNVLTLVIPIFGLLHLEDYRDSLLAAEQEALQTQAQSFAVSLGAVAVRSSDSGEQQLLHETTRLIIRQLFTESATRARVFSRSGTVVGDSILLSDSGSEISVTELPPPGAEVDQESFGDWISRAYESFFNMLLGRPDYAPYPEGPNLQVEAFDEALGALMGDQPTSVRRAPNGKLVVTAAVPVQRYRQIVAALLLTKQADEVSLAVSDRRQDVLVIFGLALAVTIMISFYLARTIGRPIHQLAVAADQIRGGRTGLMGHGEIPDFTDRNDEIGNLSAALIDMTQRLQERMHAIEGFAADVAHEIKNPLTSLRSAVETASRLENAQQQKKLMQIILDDVARLDRLISDISDASRLDAELQREEMEAFDLAHLLEAFVEIQKAAAMEEGPDYELELPKGPLTIVGIEGRIGQVFRNLLANATSFSPKDSTIHVKAWRERDEDGQPWVVVSVADEGTGIPANKLEDIFNRFYSERPSGEKFGTHSGLGLSISRQIVEVHGGMISATNRYKDGEIAGAIFTVSLPAEE